MSAQHQTKSVFNQTQRYSCFACDKRFTEWEELETHPCKAADEMQESEYSRTIAFSDLRWNHRFHSVEDDYSEDSRP